MRTMTMILAAAVAAGCHDHHDHDDDVLNTGGTWYVQYANGHPLAASTTDPSVLSQENELLSLVNDHRAAIGVPALIDSGPMRDVARAHSIHMAIGDFTGRVNPEGDDPGDRADIVGIGWTLYAENIDYGTSNAFDVYDEWLAGAGTHDAIDDPDFVYAGVGYEHDASSIWNDYWTMDFRHP